MYSESITARRIRNFESAYRVELRELPIPYVRERVQYLQGRRDPTDPKAKRWIRPPITPEFRRFVENELAMCKASFLYWARRYAFIQLAAGDGGFGLLEPWESQLILLSRIASSEEFMWMRRDAGDHNFEGICYFIHKARQLGFTALCQLLLLHRSLFYSGTRCLSASMNDQATQKMHKRFQVAYSKLPWWMQTKPIEWTLDRGVLFANESYSYLQDFSQQAGLGQGEQWDCTHLTEVASVPDEYCQIAINNHFLPTISQSVRGMAFLESTSQGMGNWWHRSTEQARRGEFVRFGYCFIGWYAEPSRWSDTAIHPPGHPGCTCSSSKSSSVDWQPDEDTLAHAKKIEMTSAEFMGYVYTPTLGQLHWYERNRNSATTAGAKKEFLVNFCATPEESFQHSGSGAFDGEVIDWLDNHITIEPVAYELATTTTDLSARRPDRQIIHASGQSLVPVYMSPRDKSDPRGLLLMFEPPRRDAVYSIGGDSADGIPGWHRTTRTASPEELKKDNAASGAWYINPDNGLTVQACEFAGPLTPKAFAPVLAALCRLYRGPYDEEMGGELILEVAPAVGGAQTQAALQYEHNFGHFYRWTVFNGSEVKETNSFGWVSNSRSVREIWIKAKDLLENKDRYEVRPQSRYLLAEMHYAVWDPLRMRGMAQLGQHDDRISQMLFALWRLHNWGFPIAQRPPENQWLQPWQRTAAQRTYPDGTPAHRVDFAERDIATKEQLEAAYDEWWNGQDPYAQFR